MINTKDLRMTVGHTVPVRITARDYKGAPISLTPPSIVSLSLTADLKVPPLFIISSSDTLLVPGAFDTVIGGRAVQNNVGNPITLSMVADSLSGVAITVNGNDHTIHYQPGVSTVLAVETAIGLFTTGSIVVVTPGTGATVLSSGAAFAKRVVTECVILEQNSYPGQYVATLLPARTQLLVPTGDDDPYFWEADVVDSFGRPFDVVATSRFSVFKSARSLNGV